MAQDAITLTVEPRSVTGKAVKHLRKDGLVPAVIHDHGKESVLVQGPYLELYRVYQHAGKHHPIELKAGGHNYTALIKDVEFEPRKNQLTHIVFNAVNKNQKVEAEVPIRPRYAEGNDSAPAERAGLIVLEQLGEVEVKATPDKIPDFLEYDAEKLVEIGDQLSVEDLIVPEGVEIMTEPHHSIATVFEPSALEAANNEAGGTADAEAIEVAESGEVAGEGESAEPVEAEKPEA